MRRIDAISGVFRGRWCAIGARMVADKGRLRGWRYPVQFLDGANPAQLRVVDRPLATLRQFARRRVPVTFAPGGGAMDDADERPLTD